MKLTNLDMVQSILSALGSDEVNSVSDTTESRQVLEVLRTTYFNIVSRAGLTNQKQLVQLDPSLDPSIPVIMYVPDGIKKVEWIKYFNESNNPNGSEGHGVNTDLVPNINTTWSTTSGSSVSIGTGAKVFTVTSSTLEIDVGDYVVASATADTTNYMYGTVTSYVGTTLTINITTTHGVGTFSNWGIQGGTTLAPVQGYQYVTILPVKQFLDMVNGFNPSENDVDTFVFTDDSNGYPNDFTFYYKTQKQPQYCTVLSDYYVIFDGYDSTFDSTLQSSKTMAEGSVVPVYTMTDSFVPNLPEDQFPLLLSEAKSLAFFELKQSTHPIAERDSRRQWGHLQKGKSVADVPTSFDALPNFGRNFQGGVSLFKTMGWDR